MDGRLLGNSHVTKTQLFRFDGAELSDRELHGQDLVDMSVGIALATGIVMAVMAVIVYVAIAFLVKSGRGWARIVGAVLAAISITHLFAMTMPAGIFTVLQVASGIFAIIFCFIAPGSKYFTDMKNLRLANKMH